MFLRQPFREVGLNKFIVGEVRVSFADAVDFRRLSRREPFMRIETEPILQQALTAEHLMDPRNAASKAIRCIEESGVAIGYLCAARKQFAGD